MKRKHVLANNEAGESPTRQKIVAAARRDFFAHGFRAVTMDELAKELGMSKKTLYAHFPSKTSLLEAMLLDKFHDLEGEADRITTECKDDFVTGLKRLLACLQRHTAEVQPAFVRDIQREEPELFKVVDGRRRELIQQHFGKLLSEGRREGLIRKDVPVSLIIEILLAAVQAIMNPPRMAELGLTPTSGFSAILNVILEGVITTEGRSRL